MATDIRFKAAAFFLFASWLVIVFSLWHSIKHYKLRNQGPFDRTIGGVKLTPRRFRLTIFLALIIVGYSAASAFDFEISVIKVQIPGSSSNVAWVYGLGWTPIAMILLVQEVSGYLIPNEDRALIRQRRSRGAETDRELGIVMKPHWWSRLHSADEDLNIHDAIARNVKELGGGRAITRNFVEMGNMPASRASERRDEPLYNIDTPEAVTIGASILFSQSSDLSERKDPFADASEGTFSKGRGRVGAADIQRGGSASFERSLSAQRSISLNGPPQKVRSMLDV
ncbi:MAG: hypothetical protein M1818_000591 [Claussenomyces sp. TS43310]|nr:MAG: hypothetical protein M1818_000591 [Claussenomyces sp. TS43310]